MSKKSTAIYRVLIREAWNITWTRKSLWIFGLFAGLISSGGAIEALLSGSRTIATTGTWLTRTWQVGLTGSTFPTQLIQSLLRFGTMKTTAVLIFLTLLGLFILVFGLTSQATLIRGTKSEKTSEHVLLKLFVLNLLTKVLMGLLTVLATLPTILLLTQQSSFASFLFFIHFLLYIPAVLILHTIFLLAMIDVVLGNHPVLHAIHHAVHIFKKHWLSTLEFACILFSIVLFVGILMVMSLALLSIPYTLLFTSSLLTGSLSLFLFINTFFAIIALLFILLCGSIIVTFQYSAWRLFYARAVHRIHGNKTISKFQRLIGSD